MNPDPHAADERRTRLERIRREIERASAAAAPVDANDLRLRHPDLEPELSALLAGFAATQHDEPARDSADHEAATILGATAAMTPTVHGPGATAAYISGGPVTESDMILGGSTMEDRPAPDPDPNRETADASGAGNGTPARDGHDRGEPLPPGQRVRYVGDYELIAVIGQGGMGIVYKARQISVNRPVALKMIRNAEFASAEQIQRFQNEAESVAQLDHAGIVPIYEVGSHGDQHYFSMKLIEGSNVEHQLSALAADPRQAAEVVAEVADAVHHAHRRGILHRDLKPANILIDAAGHPHVTDFGLAKKIEGDAGLTVSGAIMGTPAYMAPEQALGRTREVTTATDVYGIGAIFYAAITGRAPFGANSVLETLEQVRYTPPVAPSRRNARLPADLEVISLKCLEKDPRRRYASAAAVADDLRRWLRNEPILARPVGPAVRLWMWCKRKPAMAALSAALAAALVIGVGAITLQWRHAVELRLVADHARDRALVSEQAAVASEKSAVTSAKAAVASEKAAQAARGQAEQNAQTAGVQATLALNTIQDLITQVQQNFSTPNLYEFKKNLLDSSIRRIDAVAGVYDKSTSKEATTLAALFELGKIYRQLGQTEKAHRQFEKCLAIAKERVKIKQGSDASRQNLANSYFELALSSEEHRRDMKASLAANREGLKTWQEIHDHPNPAGFPIDPKAAGFWLAEAHIRVGIGLYRMGELEPAREEYRKGYNLRKELVEKYPNEARFRQDLSYSVMALAETAFRLGDPKQADTYYAQVLDQREAMARERPDDLLARSELGGAHYMVGEFKMKSNDLATARTQLQASRERRESLVKADARNAIYKRDLAKTLYRLGNLADLEKKPEEARTAFAGVLAIRDELARSTETNDRLQMELMLALAHAGKIAEASELADRLAAGPNVDRELRFDLARCYAQCARGTPASQAERAQTFQVKAVEALRAAVAEGYRDHSSLETEPDLEPIRGRDDFERLLPP